MFPSSECRPTLKRPWLRPHTESEVNIFRVRASRFLDPDAGGGLCGLNYAAQEYVHG
jgi:hypothetical protein